MKQYLSSCFFFIWKTRTQHRTGSKILGLLNYVTQRVANQVLRMAYVVFTQSN